ncbi:MAG TPA: hypothetical protein PK978_05550 [Paludibacter sp.]|nr:hypothetical protein [Paludibacter sp.]
MKITEIHIGEMVKAFVRQSNIRDVDFAKMIGRSKQNVYDMYKRSDFEVKLLLTCSIVLGHNFFNDIYPKTASDDELIDAVFDTLKEVVKEKRKEKSK